MTKERFDIKQHVTDTIIAQIEAGTPPWRKPWTGDMSGASFPLRHNGEQYRGINILMLWATAHVRGYNSARWMTFKQALELGGCVKKGEKATKTVFYGSIERENENVAEGEDGNRCIRFVKTNNVFNADQIDEQPGGLANYTPSYESGSSDCQPGEVTISDDGLLSVMPRQRSASHVVIRTGWTAQLPPEAVGPIRRAIALAEAKLSREAHA